MSHPCWWRSGNNFLHPFSFFQSRHSLLQPPNCFVPEINLDQSREDSSTEISRRIEHTLDPNSSSSPSLPAYSPSYTFSIPSSALNRHHDNFAHIEYRWQPAPSA